MTGGRLSRHVVHLVRNILGPGLHSFCAIIAANFARTTAGLIRGIHRRSAAASGCANHDTTFVVGITQDNENHATLRAKYSQPERGRYRR